MDVNRKRSGSPKTAEDQFHLEVAADDAFDPEDGLTVKHRGYSVRHAIPTGLEAILVEGTRVGPVRTEHPMSVTVREYRNRGFAGIDARIEFPDGETGWVSAGYLVLDGTPTIAPRVPQAIALKIEAAAEDLLQEFGPGLEIDALDDGTVYFDSGLDRFKVEVGWDGRLQITDDLRICSDCFGDWAACTHNNGCH